MTSRTLAAYFVAIVLAVVILSAATIFLIQATA